ncbi:MAG: hypothetical protein KKH75_10885 [Actinobacteria bacterium]|nr:hypothetical protein [Actinomycetota bacterium]
MIPAVVVIGVLSAALSACAGGASAPERTAWQQWADTAVKGAQDGAISGLAGFAGQPGTAALDLPAPQPVTSISLSCTGSDTMSFVLTFSDGTDTVSRTQDLVCADGAPRTPIAMPSGLTGLTQFTASVSSVDGAGAWAAVLHG